MHENSAKLLTTYDPQSLRQAALEVANMAPVMTSDDSTVRYAAVTLAASLPVLATIVCAEGETRVTVNCEKMVISSMLVKSLKDLLPQL